MYVYLRILARFHNFFMRFSKGKSNDWGEDGAIARFKRCKKT